MGNLFVRDRCFTGDKLRYYNALLGNGMHAGTLVCQLARQLAYQMATEARTLHSARFMENDLRIDDVVRWEGACRAVAER